MTELKDDTVTWSPVDGHRPSFVVIPSSVSWSSERPLEIKIVFGTPGQFTDEEDKDVIVWVLSRDLIPQARKAAVAGDGDAQFVVLGDSLTLSLRTEVMAITLSTDAKPLEDFIARTYAEVPAGEEGALLPLTDADLERWLA